MRTALIDHRLLDGSQRAIRRINAFDRDNMLARGVRERHQAGRHRSVTDLTFDQFADENGTSSAVTLSTADLSTLEILVIADEVEDGRASRQLRCDLFIV